MQYLGISYNLLPSPFFPSSVFQSWAVSSSALPPSSCTASTTKWHTESKKSNCYCHSVAAWDWKIVKRSPEPSFSSPSCQTGLNTVFSVVTQTHNHYNWHRAPYFFIVDLFTTCSCVMFLCDGAQDMQLNWGCDVSEKPLQKQSLRAVIMQKRFSITHTHIITKVWHGHTAVCSLPWGF